MRRVKASVSGDTLERQTRRHSRDEDRSRSLDKLTRLRRRFPLSVRAGDLGRALADPAEMERQDPTNPIQRVLLERMRITSPDDLTAADQALWHLMIAIVRQDLARAFADGKEAPAEHVLPMEQARSYLGTTAQQVGLSVDRLTATFVRFDVATRLFRSYGQVPMVIAYHRVERETGAQSIRFTLPGPLTEILEGSGPYAYVELAALPRFATKYGSRLYGFLVAHRPAVVVAGFVRISVRLDELVEVLGGRWGDGWHYGMWKKRVLIPAAKAVADASRRIGLAAGEDGSLFVETRGLGRGGPVVEVSFHVSYAPLRPDEVNPHIPARFGIPPRPEGAAALRDLTTPDPVHPRTLIPRPPEVGRILRMMGEDHGKGINPRLAVCAWKDALDEAHLGVVRKDVRTPRDGDVSGRYLRETIEKRGVAKAFEIFLRNELMKPRFMVGSTNDYVRQHYLRNFDQEMPPGYRYAEVLEPAAKKAPARQVPGWTEADFADIERDSGAWRDEYGAELEDAFSGAADVDDDIIPF